MRILKDQMTIKIEAKTEKYLIDSIKRFFSQELDDDIGDLKAMRVLDFCVKEIGPSIYNQAIADAQAYFQEKTSDLGGERYEPEFYFWKKK
jgi:uncharacterized protein (DUF2164 family)